MNTQLKQTKESVTITYFKNPISHKRFNEKWIALSSILQSKKTVYLIFGTINDKTINKCTVKTPL